MENKLPASTPLDFSLRELLLSKENVQEMKQAVKLYHIIRNDGPNHKLSKCKNLIEDKAQANRKCAQAR